MSEINTNQIGKYTKTKTKGNYLQEELLKGKYLNENQKKNSFLKERAKTNDKISAFKRENQININISKKEEKNYMNPIKINSEKNIFSPENKHEIIRHQDFYNKRLNMFLVIMIFLIFPSFSHETKKRFFFSYSSNITIMVQGIGMQSIFYGGTSCGNSIFTKPEEVYINNIRQDIVKDKYNFTKSPNIIKLVWSSTMSNCNCLFRDCTNIIEMDFSKFDFSNGLSAYEMFYNCNLLTSLNMPYSGTIKIHSIINMFSFCSSLTSLDVSKFDVYSLTDTSGMFRGCKSMISLDLSNFSGSFYYGKYMFYDCPNLIFVNLGYAHYCRDGNDITNFLGTPKNIVFYTGCGNIQPLVNNYGCAISYCSNNCDNIQKKYNTGDNTCVDNCFTTRNNKYHYYSKCYTVCPSGTYPSGYECENCHRDCKTCDKKGENNNSNCKACKSPDKCLKFGNCVYIDYYSKSFYYDENDSSIKICRCDLNKCFKCSKESYDQNLCITCNEGFYPKENHSVTGVYEVELKPNETKELSITLGSFQNTGTYPSFYIYPEGSANFSTDSSYTMTCTVSGNGVNFTFTGGETGGALENRTPVYLAMSDPTNLDGIANYYWNQKKETFLEPGLSYTFDVTVVQTPSSGAITTYHGRATKTVEQSTYESQDGHRIKLYVK